MPTKKQNRNSDIFVFNTDEALPEILTAVLQGQLESFIKAQNALKPIIINHVQHPVKHPAQLYLMTNDPLYNYSKEENIATIAAYHNHIELLNYLLTHKEQLGLTNQDFIKCVDTANSRRATPALKTTIEQYPEVIIAYNEAMASHHKHYQTDNPILSAKLQK